MRRNHLTAAQHRAAVLLFEKGYVIHNSSFHNQPQSNRPYWALVEMGLADFDFGPRNSWLKCQGFMPVWSDPIC